MKLEDINEGDQVVYIPKLKALIFHPLTRKGSKDDEKK